MAEELKLDIKEVAYDEALAEQNLKENGELFKDKITDGFGEDQPECEVYPPEEVEEEE